MGSPDPVAAGRADEPAACVPARRSTGSWLLHRWPAALGLLAAASQLATGANRDTALITVCVAALCYLGAAALGRPWVAWAAIPGASAVVVASELLGLVWWAGLGLLAIVLVVVGVLRREPRPVLDAQAVAVLAFGAPAVVALYLAPTVGMVVAGVVLASHTVWDVIHYRRNAVVPRSLAEACMFLDLPLGAAVVVLALAG